jgi:hypothetical protein
MNVKIVSVIAFLALGAFCLLAGSASMLNGSSWICQNTKARAMLPRTAGCYYQAYFQKDPSTQQLEFERKRLKKYVSSGGAVRHILWYRSVFHQRFKEQSGNSARELEAIHRTFTRAAPSDIKQQVSYFLFVRENYGIEASQDAFDYYCKNYILKRKSMSGNLATMMASAKIELSFDNCIAHWETELANNKRP